MDKAAIRERIWGLMEEEGVARFPGTWGRIPNYVGAQRAADRLLTVEVWRQAKVIKANPDSPQRPVRSLALRQGKRVYMAVPRLRKLKCFIELDPLRLDGKAEQASTIKGAFKWGRPIHPEEMERVDLVVAGSVAVTRDGARLGKGGGYSDLEFGIARQFGLIGEGTSVLTTVHPLQLVSDDIEMKVHDIPVDYIVTPQEVILTNHEYSKPEGLYWELLEEETLRRIPIVRRLREDL
ncbi:MAG: 5-formyltetrahydrofolate cyclo-ligase [Anaerolineae bacterium]|nr:5-formyltetrahydrofolate cyclo-ligase [Anaerolineae bacterium]NIN97280.1 5-formyltetrahydrofolate cyclo-ligase [Anaerolineae bacterium]NIQ80210.1 5-formyltetrahydrofolate cyclo-ligase [Anaerolineae bacterium]